MFFIVSIMFHIPRSSDSDFSNRSLFPPQIDNTSEYKLRVGIELWKPCMLQFEKNFTKHFYCLVLFTYFLVNDNTITYNTPWKLYKFTVLYLKFRIKKKNSTLQYPFCHIATFFINLNISFKLHWRNSCWETWGKFRKDTDSTTSLFVIKTTELALSELITSSSLGYSSEIATLLGYQLELFWSHLNDVLFNYIYSFFHMVEKHISMFLKWSWKQ